MSDLNRRAAELVMGWKAVPWMGGGPSWMAEDPDLGTMVEFFHVREFDPEHRWDHAGLLWDQLARRGVMLEMENTLDGRAYRASVTRPDDKGRTYIASSSESTGPAAITAVAVAATEEME